MSLNFHSNEVSGPRKGGGRHTARYGGGVSNMLYVQYAMQTAIDTMFVNEKIIRIYSFCLFSP